ncbi:breast cancer type 1 susceptibility protein [Limosa lapponica baueri]|uniref:RING-type E3 ubiquitin transferase BRCA1 n=1 Tax=Limosa lapponica baueri TaxID=1758121 RepID=A0A2I0U5H9_LIMLA|nr:breast cancer type 1 susceptibility protein [Limosa lapponica baueri]
MEFSLPAAGEVQGVLSAMQKNLECPICLDVVKEPVSTKCDHIFCRFCMFKLLSKKKKGVTQCPLCKTEVTKRLENKTTLPAFLEMKPEELQSAEKGNEYSCNTQPGKLGAKEVILLNVGEGNLCSVTFWFWGEKSESDFSKEGLSKKSTWSITEYAKPGQVDMSEYQSSPLSVLAVDLLAEQCDRTGDASPSSNGDMSVFKHTEEMDAEQTQCSSKSKEFDLKVSRKRLKRSIQKVNEWFSKSNKILSSSSSRDDSAASSDVSEKTDPMVDSMEIAVVEGNKRSKGGLKRKRKTACVLQPEDFIQKKDVEDAGRGSMWKKPAEKLVVDRNSVSPDPAEPQIDSYPSSEEPRKADSEQRQVRRSRRLQLLSEEMTKETGGGVVITGARKCDRDHEGSFEPDDSGHDRQNVPGDFGTEELPMAKNVLELTKEAEDKTENLQEKKTTVESLSRVANQGNLTPVRIGTARTEGKNRSQKGEQGDEETVSTDIGVESELGQNPVKTCQQRPAEFSCEVTGEKSSKRERKERSDDALVKKPHNRNVSSKPRVSTPLQINKQGTSVVESSSNVSEESVDGAQELKKPLIQVHTPKQVSNVDESKEIGQSCDGRLKRSRTNFRDDCQEDPHVGANLGEASGFDSETSNVEDSCGPFSQGEILTTQQKNAMQNNLKKLQQEMAALEAVLKQHGSQEFLPIHGKLPHSSSEGTLGMEQMRQERGAESTSEGNFENRKCRSSKGFSSNVMASDCLNSKIKELEKESLSKRPDSEKGFQSDKVLKSKAPSEKTKPVQEAVQEHSQCQLEAENADEQKSGTRLNTAANRSVAAQNAEKSCAQECTSKRTVCFPISVLHNVAGKENATSPVVTYRKEMSIVASGLNQSEHLVVQKFARKTHSTLSNHITEETTHVIMKTDKELVCERTLKYFLGIAGRKWVVSYQWVIQSFKEGRILDEENFEVRGDVINGRNHQGPKRARQSLTEKVFKGFEICCYGPFTDMTTAIQQKNNVAMVTREWVLDSVACYQCQELGAYLVS